MSRIKQVARAEWMTELLRILRKLDKGYYVRRGSIVWSTFTWPKDRVVAVRAAENFPADDVTGLRTTTLEVTVVTRIPQAEDEVDDAILEELEQDVILALQALRQAKAKDGKTGLIMNVTDQGSVELSDLEFRVQGYYVTFTVEY